MQLVEKRRDDLGYNDKNSFIPRQIQQSLFTLGKGETTKLSLHKNSSYDANRLPTLVKDHDGGCIFGSMYTAYKPSTTYSLM